MAPPSLPLQEVVPSLALDYARPIPERQRCSTKLYSSNALRLNVTSHTEAIRLPPFSTQRYYNHAFIDVRTYFDLSRSISYRRSHDHIDAMVKEKSINPAQAARKAEKAKAIKKGKAELASRRTEKLAKKNPDRLQKQLDDLKAIGANGGKLTTHEQRMVEELEKEIKQVKKAREALGDKAPALGRGGGDRTYADSDRGRGVLGKRGRDGRRRNNGDSDSDEVPEEVRNIPMPRDTPPPIPKEVLDKWYQARRDKWAAAHPDQQPRDRHAGATGQGANSIPLGANARAMPDRSGSDAGPSAGTSISAPPKPAVEVKTVYESAPVLRDLRKEAVAFVPTVVRQKIAKVKGQGGLVEPEEADKLEKAGYVAGGGQEAAQEESINPKSVTMEEVEDDE